MPPAPDRRRDAGRRPTPGAADGGATGAPRGGRGTRRAGAAVAGAPPADQIARRTRRRTGRCGRPWPASTRAEASEPMARRNRLDAELVRRGLARSREQAAELVAAGRVEVRGTVAAQGRRHGRPGRPGAWSPGEPTGRRLRLPGRAQAGRRAGRVRPAGCAVAGPALPGRGRVHRRLHRRAAAPRRGRGGRGRRRLRPARLVAAHRRAGDGAGAHQRAHPDPGGDRRPGRR